jgi:hypothetical protein
MGWYRTSFGISSDGCGANVYVNEDGSVLLYTGITEMGQGSFTVLSQICAEALGVEIEDIRLVHPDTDRVPESGPTVASRSTVLMGNAIIQAVQQIKESIMEIDVFTNVVILLTLFNSRMLFRNVWQRESGLSAKAGGPLHLPDLTPKQAKVILILFIHFLLKWQKWS